MRPTAIMAFARQGSGSSYAGGALDTQTVTVGGSGTAVLGNRTRGFISSSLGSVSDGTSNLYGGAAIIQLVADENGSSFDVIFQVTGVQANSGWTSMNVGGGNVLLRSAATFSTAGGNSSWTWPGAGNLFGSPGATKVVGFN